MPASASKLDRLFANKESQFLLAILGKSCRAHRFVQRAGFGVWDFPCARSEACGILAMDAKCPANIMS
jgi:hypothetical protein